MLIGVFSLVADEALIDELVARARTVMPEEATMLCATACGARASRPARGVLPPSGVRARALDDHVRGDDAHAGAGRRPTIERTDAARAKAASCPGSSFSVLCSARCWSSACWCWGPMRSAGSAARRRGIRHRLDLVDSAVAPARRCPLPRSPRTLYLGPDTDQPRWRLLSPGAVHGRRPMARWRPAASRSTHSLLRVVRQGVGDAGRRGGHFRVG